MRVIPTMTFEGEILKPSKPNESSEFGETDCSICYETMNDVNISITKCGHKFHTSCLIKSVLIKTTCPYCRDKLIDGPEPIRSEEAPNLVEASNDAWRRIRVMGMSDMPIPVPQQSLDRMRAMYGMGGDWLS